MSARPAEVLVDAQGMRCPWPALRLAKAMASAERVRLLADDPAASAEIYALAQSKGWQLIENPDGWLVIRRTPI